MGLILILFIYGVPAVLAVVGIAFLIRASMADKTGARERKPTKYAKIAVVADKMHYYISNPSGFYHMYYISLKFDDNDIITFKTNKSIIKKFDIDDTTKVYYQGQKIIKLELFKKSGKKSTPREIHLTNWKDLPNLP